MSLSCEAGAFISYFLQLLILLVLGAEVTAIVTCAVGWWPQQTRGTLEANPRKKGLCLFSPLGEEGSPEQESSNPQRALDRAQAPHVTYFALDPFAN